MGLKIIAAADKGDLKKERLGLTATKDLNIHGYVVIDKTFDEEGDIANLGRHAYKFPAKEIKKGDQVVLYTREQMATEQNERGDNGITTHFFYWGRGQTVWNRDGDTATLLHITDSKAV